MRAPAPVLDEATAWGLAQILTRQALHRTRALAHRELHRDLPLSVSEDLARTVLVWLIWDQSRGRAQHDHPGINIAKEWPTTVPEAATAYQRMLLEPLLGADAETQTNMWVEALMMITADQAIVAEGTDRPSDGEPQVSMTVDGLSLPDPGGTRPVACPVCGATNDLRLAWDGYAGTVTCPDGHGEWLPGIGRREWRWIYATATRQR
ncbi:hypothetical protein ACWGKS_27195 [Nocardiopsis sp. NPDC055879]